MSHTTSTNVPALGAHEREDIGNQLQATLVELVDLALLGKQLHWTVVGREFRALHHQLDELVDAWRELADTVAERAAAVGYIPDGRAGTVAAECPVEPVERAAIADAEVVRLLTHRLAEVAERARIRMDRVAAGDAVSQDVMVEVVRTLEQQLWMLRAQLAHAGA